MRGIPLRIAPRRRGQADCPPTEGAGGLRIGKWGLGIRGWQPATGNWQLLRLAFCLLLFPLPVLGADITGRVVNEKGEGIAQAVVFVQSAPDNASGPAPGSAVMDQIHKTFVPGILPVMVGTEVRFPNHDQIHHHVYSFSRAKKFELPLYKGEEAPPVLFDQIGVVKIGCNIHDWMSGVILVAPTPYYALTNETGLFILRDLPPGAYPLAVWHELSQSKLEETVQQVQVKDTTQDVLFRLSLKSVRSRPPLHGSRGYQ